MKPSVANARRSTEVHSLDGHLPEMDLRMAKASIAVHSAEQAPISADVVSLVLDTITSIGMSDKEACYHMNFDASQFSRVKKNEARLPVDALWRMPDRFWLEFRRRIDDAKHLSGDRQREIRAARIGELVRLLVEGVA